MIDHFNWFIGTLFLMAAFGALMNPPFYVAIAIILVMISLLLLPPRNRMIQKCSQWQIKGGLKGTIILICLIIICLFVPQVKTNPPNFSICSLETRNSI
jgi:NADH:ubiquinone oxidoreductase subunit 6 (subunit J)